MNKDMQRMMKQAQQMAAQMQQAQEELAGAEFEAAAGGGAVSATVTGDHKLVRLDIDAGFFEGPPDADDLEMLADTVVAAVNAAMEKAREAQADTLGPLAGGMGGLGLPGV